MRQGKLIGIAIRPKSRAPMTELLQAEVSPEQGIVGDFRGKPGRRQITVLSSEVWKTVCTEMDQPLPWTVRRANLFVEGLFFADSISSILRIGSVVLEITGETEPCERMNEQMAGLCDLLTPEWRGGVCCRVITGGWIATGTKVTLDTPLP